jgi:hypothetical protein
MRVCYSRKRARRFSAPTFFITSYLGRCDGLLTDLAGMIKETFDH